MARNSATCSPSVSGVQCGAVTYVTQRERVLKFLAKFGFCVNIMIRRPVLVAVRMQHRKASLFVPNTERNMVRQTGDFVYWINVHVRPANNTRRSLTNDVSATRLVKTNCV